ncbi:peptidylprolyl isomerase [Paenibacillus nasutitermitis]|uniref:Foldase protein PrsA n=1 Tax=Paenibacillus nasutitermitis TaxID=1652958 RepID=A0A917E3B8_9BACL|nr:peptidylprolyl isomerase [Paenibacillus nasutitermitis]GGD99541.1 foldase protein PrsA [Paenibacillus nasutitermitis]
MSRTNWKKGVLLLFATMLVVVLAAGCGKKKNEEGTAPGETEGKVIVTYKDGTVTEKEFDKYATFFGIVQPQTEMYLSIPQLKEQFLREYVGYKILKARIGDKEDKALEEEINTFYTQIKQQIDATPEVKAKADKVGLTEADIRYFYTMITSIMKDEESKVTDADVKAQFDKTKDDYNVISVRHILIGTVNPETGEETRKEEEALKIAQDVKKKLDAGGDWKALAKEFSDDTGSKENGGLYENEPAKSWVAEFKEAANKQEIGKVGEPVKSSYGYHVMKVEKREATSFDKLTEEDKAELKQIVASENLNTFMTKELPDLITKVDLPAADAGAANGTEGGATNGETDGTKDNGAAGGDETPDAGSAGNKEEPTK